MDHQEFYDQMGLHLKEKRLYQLWALLDNEFFRSKAKELMYFTSLHFHAVGGTPQDAAEEFFETMLQAVMTFDGHYGRKH